MNKRYLLNFGLAFVLIYAGIDQLLHPVDWVGYLPSWLPTFSFSKEQILMGHSVVDIILGLALLFKIYTRLAAGLVALVFLGIIVANGFGRDIFLITFRDVGLFFTALYLAWDKEDDGLKLP
jgi:uncharacterized membrane protein